MKKKSNKNSAPVDTRTHYKMDSYENKPKEIDEEKISKYTQFTIFWYDFSCAEKHGRKAICNTFKEVFSFWRDDYEFLTELIKVLNQKHLQWKIINKEVSNFYFNLCMIAQNYGVMTWTDDELAYFLETICLNRQNYSF